MARVARRHLGVALPGTYTSQTFPSEHSPTNNRIDFKTDQNGRVATMQLYIGLLRLEDSQFSLSAWALPGCGAALEHRIPDTEKQEFPATTILMCFIINYYFAINSVYQKGGGQLKKPNEQVTRHTNQM